VSRPFPSWNRSILTEIYLCHACSYHEIEDGNGRAGLLASTTSLKLVSIDIDHGGAATVLAHNIHRSTCRAMAVSPDGRLLATGGGDRFIKLWRLLPSGEVVQPPLTYIAHAATVNRLAFDHRGVTLVSIGEDETVLLWDVQREIKDHSKKTSKAAAAVAPPPSTPPKARTPPKPTKASREAWAEEEEEAGPAEAAGQPSSSSSSFPSSVAMVRSTGQSTLLWLQQHTLRVLDLQTKRSTALPSSRQVALLAVEPPAYLSSPVEPPSAGGSERGVPGGRVGAAQHIATAEPRAGADGVALIELWSRGGAGGDGGGGAPMIRMPDLRYHDQGVACMEFLPPPPAAAAAAGTAGGRPASSSMLVSAGVAAESCVVLWDIATGVVLQAASVDHPIATIRALPPSSSSSSSDVRRFVSAGACQPATCTPPWGTYARTHARTLRPIGRAGSTRATQPGLRSDDTCCCRRRFRLRRRVGVRLCLRRRAVHVFGRRGWLNLVLDRHRRRRRRRCARRASAAPVRQPAPAAGLRLVAGLAGVTSVG
jgi:hypothetical protein